MVVVRGVGTAWCRCGGPVARQAHAGCPRGVQTLPVGRGWCLISRTNYLLAAAELEQKSMNRSARKHTRGPGGGPSWHSLHQTGYGHRRIMMMIHVMQS